MGFWVAVVRAGNGMMKREAAMQRPRLDRWRLRREKWKNKKNSARDSRSEEHPIEHSVFIQNCHESCLCTVCPDSKAYLRRGQLV